MTAFSFRVSACCAALWTLLIILPETLAGQQPNSSSTDSSASTISPDRKRIADLASSRVYIFVGKTGLGHDHGVEGKLQAGSVTLGSDRQAGTFVFDMNSFDADTSAARRYVGLAGTTDTSTREKVNANMKGPVVLDVGRFPTARFDIQSARLLKRPSRRGNPVYQLAGQFTLHGVARAIQFNAEAVPIDGATRLRGGFAIRQSQFGIKPFTKALGAVGVADELRIYGDILLLEQDTAASTATATTAEADRQGVVQKQVVGFH